MSRITGPLRGVLGLLILLILTIRINAQVIFTEVMYDVDGSDYHDEFIEIYNLSPTETIDLKGWTMSDSLNTDKIADAGYGMLIRPGQFAVILDGSYFANSATYDNIIPESALIITISDNAFGSSGLPNTTARELSIIDSTGNIIGRYRYTTDNESGFSDEKILISDDNSLSNWGNSSVKGGTPGYRNSISPSRLDIGFRENSIRYIPDTPLSTGMEIRFECMIYNLGTDEYQGEINFRLFVDMDTDSIADPGEFRIIDINTSNPISTGDSVIFEGSWTPDFEGNYTITAKIESDSDENESNNLSATGVYVMEGRSTVRINEIKFLTIESEPEWFEITNDGKEPVSLKNWAVADKEDTVIIDTAAYILPGQFKVITESKSLTDFYEVDDTLLLELENLPTLNNSEDMVRLIHPAGETIEEVHYTDLWLEGESWRKPSIERINIGLGCDLQSSWGPSTDIAGGTPGKVNSIFSDFSSSKMKISIQPNPFSPDGDGFEDHAVISVNSPTDASRIRLEIFDILGRKIRTLSDNRFSGSTQTFVWDGRDDHSQKARIGIYIIFLQVLDDRNGILEEFKETVVLAGRLD
ncbi:MAG: lamin tail domain-containing protein [Calditrichaceae bacterium]